MLRAVTFKERKRETKCQSGTNFVDRMPIRECVAYGDVEAQIVVNLPDQADQTRDGSLLAELLLVEDLRDRSDSPFEWSFKDRANKDIAVMVAGKGGRGVKVNRPPVPAL